MPQWWCTECKATVQTTACPTCLAIDPAARPGMSQQEVQTARSQVLGR